MSMSRTGADLLPGVRPNEGPKPSEVDARAVIENARRSANRGDLFDLFSLFAVDLVFFGWQSSHVPMLDRDQSLWLVAAIHVVVCAHVILRRKLPEWRARRIASTWDKAEQLRLRAK